MADDARFDSQRHLLSWSTFNRYPDIHAQLFALIVSRLKGEAVLDLCCSTGLLAQHVQDLGVKAIGLDRDADAMERGARAGITIPMVHMDIKPDNLLALIALIKRYQVTAVIARRCLPELLGDTGIQGTALAGALHGAGVTELFLEGRVPVSSPLNQFHCLDLEVQAVKAFYRVVETYGRVAYLRSF